MTSIDVILEQLESTDEGGSSSVCLHFLGAEKYAAKAAGDA
jgi:hypothetical protein